MALYERMQAICYPVHHDLGLQAYDVMLEYAPTHFHIDDEPLLKRKESIPVPEVELPEPHYLRSIPRLDLVLKLADADQYR